MRSPGGETFKRMYAWDFSFFFVTALIIFMVHDFPSPPLLRYHNPSAISSVISIIIHTAEGLGRGLGPY